MSRDVSLEERILLLAPTGRDGAVLAEALFRAGLRGVACASMDDLCSALDQGAGAAVVAEEALTTDSAECLAASLDRQPAWSDVPLVLLTSGGETTRASRRALDLLGPDANVTLLERPIRVITLVSAAQGALRARRWQYQVRSHLAALEEAGRRKDEFLGMLAHELRNPLAALSNGLHLARVDQHRDQALGIADRQVRHLGRLVEDLLEASRISQGKVSLRRERVVLANLVERALDAVRPALEARRHHLAVSLPADPVVLDGDPTRLEQILTNLLGNAAKYTDPGGHVALEARRDGGWLVLVVRDDGVGIAPNVMPVIFDLFVQGERTLDRSEGGLGIGLTLVRLLVGLHGGSVEASSDGVRKGSTFTVRLPLASAAEPRVASPTAPADGTSGLRVLVVDDNEDAAELLAMVLRLGGHDVTVAHDGWAALDLARGLVPDVLLLDIGLPGLDGYEVTRRLRREPASTGLHIVAISGYGRPEDRARSREAGFDQHLLKPVLPEDLQRMMRDLSARRASA